MGCHESVARIVLSLVLSKNYVNLWTVLLYMCQTGNLLSDGSLERRKVVTLYTSWEKLFISGACIANSYTKYARFSAGCGHESEVIGMSYLLDKFEKHLIRATNFRLPCFASEGNILSKWGAHFIFCILLLNACMKS